MPSSDRTYNEAERQLLLKIAADSIHHGLRHGKPSTPLLSDYPASLQKLRACFVTLHLDDELRGCIGSLEPRQSLLMDVAYNAFAAAFHDPRFTPLQAAEFAALEIEISVLSPPVPLHFASESELLDQLRPGVDGLILTTPGHSGTFLPSVWESLPNPTAFLAQLKRKAGLEATFWSTDIQVQRYTTESFSNRPTHPG